MPIPYQVLSAKSECNISAKANQLKANIHIFLTIDMRFHQTDTIVIKCQDFAEDLS